MHIFRIWGIIKFALKMLCAVMAQSVEHVLGKDEVAGSSPANSSKQKPLLNEAVFSRE